ncbi:alpha/beta-hydrolase [Anaeromyces robustus]|uniref:Alpha/beta-hydrolase n=1 Tax=Anaeromyces robustus TaxID=1754192 RepID=A0A1Y1X2C2_9FUNG|nr:alpha/beta-hydrolase [Anaeromyces robustus]|eukprot:ORX79852.1 alpha/beta-hydrolase [Anaeromyces robustus]
MKTTLFTCLLFVLLLFISSNKADIIEIEESDMNSYTNNPNIEKNVPFNGERLLDVYYNKKDFSHKKPVVINVYGGSWVGGNKIRYTKIGSLLEENNYVGVLPNYVLFPNGTIDDMVDDLYKAIQWTYTNIEEFGGNKDDISIVAHSAGAHLIALTIIKAALNLSNNGVKLEPLPYLKNVVLLNGPYIFDQEFIAYTLQGSTDTSNATATSDPKQQALLQQLMYKYYNDPEISPIEIIKGYEKNSINNHFNVNKFTFHYTSLDKVVPESSAKQLINEIMRTSNTQFEYIYTEGLEHASVVNGIRADDYEFEQFYLNLIKN